jgi:signal transduction histidine kinase
MSRALLVTLFGGFVTAVVLLVLGISGRIFGDLGWSAVVAMTIVAFVAEEARDRSRRLANQLVFGEKLTPREAMRSLADRLSHAASADELTELARVVVASTRCTGACVWAVMDDHLLRVVQHPVIPGARAERVALEATTVAACRTALPGTYCAAVTHQGELAAMLALTLPTGVGLPRIERRLVRDLAQHAGLLVVNARLTSRLQQQVRVVAARAGELRASRQQLVAAQDNERHRLERDIHDGAQQELVVILLRIRALERLSVGRPVQEREIDGIREAVSRTRRTLLSLASGNPPRRLVEGGLAEALRDAAALATSAHLDVTVTCDSAARLPLDVQTAIYFCCLEALQNTVKHANAARADVHVDLSEDEVVFSVTDDGMGFNSARVGQGSGLGNLVGRLAVHAGTAQIFSAQGAGTQVRCRLPLTRDMVEAGS